MKRITFDIETSGAFLGNGDFSNLELTVIAIHDSETNEFMSFFQEELHKLWPHLERADMLVGYNSDHFDIPILQKYYPGNLTAIKSLDLLKEVKQVLGRRLKLDNIAEATLGRNKTANGLEAVKWWAEGKKDKVRDYCIEDVRITNQLYEYARTHGSLKYHDYDGIREIKLNTKTWEELPHGTVGLTHTLPF